MFTVEQILSAAGAQLVSGRPGGVVSGISTDSRTIAPGELFIALKGAKFNGHNFIKDCILKGAAGAVVESGWALRACEAKNGPNSNFCIIEASDTLRALGDIARFHRMRFNIPVIAVTGSNGKTTTKEMISQILGMKYKVLKNHGTFNNLIGVPLTIFNLKKEHQVCVLEIGASHLGEIGALADIARPTVGIITNIGPAHLEFFKDIETVSQAKTELFHNFSGSDVAIWDADEGMLSGLYQTLTCKKRTFGLSEGCDFHATDIEADGGGWRFALNAAELIKIKLLARHNVLNALAAIAAADTLGIGYPQIYSALADFSAPSMRMEIIQVGGITIINDCYNSNPKSMESAIEALLGFNASGRRILISADMRELGEVSKYFHHQLGINVAEAGIDIFIGVGRMSKETAEAAVKAGMSRDAVWSCEDSEQAGGLLLKILHTGDVVLIKGSRAMKMEKICSIIYSIR